MKQTFTVIGVLVLIASIAVGAWFGYWELAKLNQANQYDVNTGGQQYQAGLIAQERDRVTAYDIAIDEAQKKNIKTTFCTVYLELTQPPADLLAAYNRICF